MMLSSVDPLSLGLLLGEKITLYLFKLPIVRCGHVSTAEGQKFQMEGTVNPEIRKKRCVGWKNGMENMWFILVGAQSM